MENHHARIVGGSTAASLCTLACAAGADGHEDASGRAVQCVGRDRSDRVRHALGSPLLISQTSRPAAAGGVCPACLQQGESEARFERQIGLIPFALETGWRALPDCSIWSRSCKVADML